jgi:hypothetical protein
MLRTALCTAAFAALSTTPSMSADFRTPNRAAYCDYVPAGEIIEGGVPAKRASIQCWTPNDGFTTYMNLRGRSHKLYAEQLEDAYAPVDRVLRYGQKFHKRGVWCTSRRKGLTCVNRSGHGWTLGVFVGYTIF